MHCKHSPLIPGGEGINPPKYYLPAIYMTGLMICLAVKPLDYDLGQYNMRFVSIIVRMTGRTTGAVRPMMEGASADAVVGI